MNFSLTSNRERSCARACGSWWNEPARVCRVCSRLGWASREWSPKERQHLTTKKLCYYFFHFWEWNPYKKLLKTKTSLLTTTLISEITETGPKRRTLFFNLTYFSYYTSNRVNWGLIWKSKGQSITGWILRCIHNLH